MLIIFHLSLTVLFSIDIKFFSLEVDSPVFLHIITFCKVLYKIKIKTLIVGTPAKKKLKDLYNPLKILLFILFIQICLGIFTLISGLNIYLASAHQITSVLLVFSALNLYFFRAK